MEKTTKTTNLSALQFVIDTYGEELPADVLERITAQRDTLQKRADAPRKESKESKEFKERVDSVLKYLTDNKGMQVGRTEVATECGITEGQATSALSALAKDGKVTKDSVKVEKRKVTVYSLAE